MDGMQEEAKKQNDEKSEEVMTASNELNPWPDMSRTTRKQDQMKEGSITESDEVASKALKNQDGPYFGRARKRRQRDQISFCG